MADIDDIRAMKFESSQETETQSQTCPACGSYSVSLEKVKYPNSFIGYQYRRLDETCGETWL